MTGAAPADDAEMAHLLDVIFHRYHYDFRRYAPASLKRRLMTALGRFGCASVGALADRLSAEPKLFTALLGYLTVQVSDLFRDPTYFRAIRDKVVPYLETYPSLKLWVAGCSTGEEAYALAIVLDEVGLLDRTLIYATDINSEALRTAAEGMYDVARFAHFSRNYLASGGTGSLSNYYSALYSSALMHRRLRDAILFSDHSLATDSVFAEVQLVSCRNVLIYFDRELQDHAVGILRDSLCRKGFLGLGSRESLRFSAHAAAFDNFAPDARIYQRL